MRTIRCIFKGLFFESGKFSLGKTMLFTVFSLITLFWVVSLHKMYTTGTVLDAPEHLYDLLIFVIPYVLGTKVLRTFKGNGPSASDAAKE
jgi:hypothetical protein